MKFLASRQLILNSFVLFIILMLNACGTTSSSNYYILEIPKASLEEIAKKQNQSAKVNRTMLDTNLSGPLIAILPVGVPNYLDRPQLVTRKGRVGLSLSESMRWGEDLSVGIARILSSSITSNLSAVKASAVPLRMGISPNYTIQVEIKHLEGALGGKVELNALWYLQKDGERIWQSAYENSVEVGNTYPDYVQAHGYLVNKFGQEVAQVFYNIYEQEKIR